MAQFHERLRIYDPELHEHLVVRLSIKPPFYAFRWLSLLLSQEFPLPDVITIWDSLFASSDRLDLLQWICLAMIERERNALLAGDFSSSLRLLQAIIVTSLMIVVIRVNGGFNDALDCDNNVKVGFVPVYIDRSFVINVMIHPVAILSNTE
ncbi:TBC1 domain family member 13 [Toxocara canis]|uniref:TBC1 domain family member 13 n=1 Tax=Toxocara canis TaxID=6265 RepID=A0A0B2UWF6_TOXCA|nr:TBC1 domain family member 13 [Toxocara canis]